MKSVSFHPGVNFFWFNSTFVRLLVGCVLVLRILGTPCVHGADRPPNVLLILADDMASGDLSSINGGISRTPHLDRLREESVWFPRACSASPVCAQARAALLTGRYPHRTGVVTLNPYLYPGLNRMRQDEVTAADLFQARGYATGLVGKWHCGHGPGYEPGDRGFDEFMGFKSHLDVPSYFNFRLEIQGKMQRFQDNDLTAELTRRAVDFMRRHRQNPFFLHLAHYAPHRPLGAREDRIRFFEAKGLGRETATVYAMVETMDEGIGKVLEELEVLGIAEDTIVLFASDNGPDPLVESRFNLGRAGTKYTVNEGGIRVPFMVRWPGRFDPGTRQDWVHFTDVLPTLAELCGLKVPSGLPWDGRSFVSALEGNANSHLPDFRFWQWNRAEPDYTHNAAVREGDWKLVRPYVTKNVPQGPSRLRSQLFHLARDPAESRDVSAQEPERVERMEQALIDWTQAVEQDRLRPGDERPNIVVILADDLGYGDLGCYGQKGHRTPRLDALAASGLRFTDFHSGGAMCSPTRASLLTGCYPQRFGEAFDSALSGTTQREEGLPLQAYTLAEALRGRGYATGCFGKWHLGYQSPLLPTRQGFDVFHGLVSGDGDYHTHVDRSGNPDWWKGEQPKTEEGYTTDLLTEHAISFMRENRQRPFFVYLPHLAIHFPWQGTNDPPHRQPGTSYQSDKFGVIPNPSQVTPHVRAMIESLDRGVGRILDELQVLGLREKTVVVFASDNGGYLRYGTRFQNISSNGPLRGEKGGLYEGGHRVPAFISWPGHIPEGTTDQTAHTNDLFPTLAFFAGAGYKAGSIDGVSLASLLLRQEGLPERTFYWRTRNQFAVREGKWKLVSPRREGAMPELFDLEADRGETLNLAKQHPVLAERMIRKWQDWNDSMIRISKEKSP